MKEKKNTIRDIAEGCGVCMATVSRAINGTAGVRSEIKDRIFQYIEDVGWRSNGLQQRVVLPPAGQYTVLLTSRAELTDDGGITHRLNDRLWQEGFLPLIFCGNISKVLEFCRQNQPFALIFYGETKLFHTQISSLLANQTRIINITRHLVTHDLLWPTFCIDPAVFFQCAVRRLQQEGHKQIGYFGEFGEFRQLPNSKNSPRHFREELANLKSALPNFCPENDSVGDCYGDLTALSQKIAQKQHTAWICKNSRLAKQFYLCATKLGFRIPEDISVIALGPQLSNDYFSIRFTRVTEDSSHTESDIISLLQKDVFPQAEIYQLSPVLAEGDSVLSKKGDCK